MQKDIPFLNLSPEQNHILNKNLTHAQAALIYTKSQLTLPATNDPGDVLGSSDITTTLLCFQLASKLLEVCSTRRNLFAAFAARATVKLSEIKEATLGTATDSLGWVERVASLAEHAKQGNCGEQSAVAFVWLAKSGVRPIEWVSCGSHDHQFVLIGRNIYKSISNISEWGATSVVCDPWQGLVYPGLYINNLKAYNGSTTSAMAVDNSYSSQATLVGRFPKSQCPSVVRPDQCQ